MGPKMDIYIEGMKQCGITMQVELSGERVTLSYDKATGVFYAGEKEEKELYIRMMIHQHYTADRRRMKDWIDDVEFMEDQLRKRKVGV